MEVILTEDVPKLGKIGDVVKVKDGYGRNFLLPQKKALMADSNNLKVLDAQKKSLQAKIEKIKKTAEEVANRLKDMELTIQKEAGTGERLFGSVTKRDIVAALHQKGIQIDKQHVELESPLRNLGTYDISIKLHPEVAAAFKLWVVRKT